MVGVPETSSEDPDAAAVDWLTGKAVFSEDWLTAAVFVVGPDRTVVDVAPEAAADVGPLDTELDEAPVTDVSVDPPVGGGS